MSWWMGGWISRWTQQMGARLDEQMDQQMGERMDEEMDQQMGEQMDEQLHQQMSSRDLYSRRYIPASVSTQMAAIFWEGP